MLSVILAQELTLWILELKMKTLQSAPSSYCKPTRIQKPLSSNMWTCFCVCCLFWGLFYRGVVFTFCNNLLLRAAQLSLGSASKSLSWILPSNAGSSVSFLLIKSWKMKLDDCNAITDGKYHSNSGMAKSLATTSKDMPKCSSCRHKNEEKELLTYRELL